MVVAAVAAGAGLLVFVLFWFQPHKLWIDERVDDPIPVVAVAALPRGPTSTSTSTTLLGAPAPRVTEPATTPAPPPQPQPPATEPVEPVEPVELRSGSFISRDHGTTGRVRVLELADGSRILRLEELATDNGPDVYVYLSTTPADGPEGDFDDTYLSLGRLQGNLGSQNYTLPGDADLSAFTSVVLWCDRFDSAFGAADLLAPA